MNEQDIEEYVASSTLGRTLQSYAAAFGWSSYTSPHRDHRGFEGPPKYVTSYKLMHFDYDQWRTFFSAKRAAETPGNFGHNLLAKEFGEDFANRYLDQAQDTTWLEEVKIMHERVIEGLSIEPDGQEDFDRAEKQMIEDGYY